MTNATEHQQNIVVGIDGSAASNSALAWAADQAALTNARLVVIAAWDYPISYGWSPMPLTPGDLDLHANAREEVTKSVKAVLGENPPIEVIEEIVEGPPKLLLVQHSADAALLVVGCRGHGAFTGMLLGSVSAYVAAHADCPVVIVHAHDAAEHEVVVPALG